MPQEIISQFLRRIDQPLEVYDTVQNTTIRDAIPTEIRFIGMEVYVIDLDIKYFLKGGIANSNWTSFATTGGGAVEFKGYFDVSVPDPVLNESNSIYGDEYIVQGASTNGTDYNFGSGNILLFNNDVILFDGSNWIVKVSNQPQDLSNYTLNGGYTGTTQDLEIELLQEITERESADDLKLDKGGYSGTAQDLKDLLDALDQAIVFKGGWDASTGSFPGGGTAQAGFKYTVTTGGTVNGIEFKNGDSIFAVIDNASTTTYSGNWFKNDNTEQTGAEILAKLLTVDGSGSGLDADLLDGVEGSQFIRSDVDDIVNGLLFINRNGQDVNLLRFNTERPWVFKQGLSGSSTALDLQPVNSNKSLRIVDPVAGESINFNSLSGRILTIGASGYATALTLASLGNNDWITKKHLADNALLATEGSFTPTLIDAEGGATYSVSTATGYYYKIGKKVHVSIVLQGISTSGTPTGVLQISNLPFSPNNTLSYLNIGSFKNIVGDYVEAFSRSSNGVLDFIYRPSASFFGERVGNALSIVSGSITVTGYYFTDS